MRSLSCQLCAKVVECVANRPSRRYCSRVCRTEAYRRRRLARAEPPSRKIECDYCGDVLHGRLTSHRRFCSARCRWRHRELVIAEREFLIDPLRETGPQGPHWKTTKWTPELDQFVRQEIIFRRMPLRKAETTIGISKSVLSKRARELRQQATA